jgi:hypothetical protein
VAVSSRSVPQTLVSVRIVKGTLTSSVVQRSEATYRLKNSDRRSRSVLVEHPISPNWELVAPARVEETTRSVYRFLVEVPGGESEQLLVAQERQINRTVVLTNINDSQITYFLSAPNVDRRVKRALESLAERKTALEQALTSIEKLRAQEERQRQELERYILSLDLP